MLPLSAELIALERQKDLLRESEELRLIRMARPITGEPPAARRIVAVAGGYMVRLGSRMQAYGTVPPVEPRAAPRLAVNADQCSSGC